MTGLQSSDAISHESVVRTVLLGLSRFGPRVPMVTVRLTHPDNPMGGIDQQCRLRARLKWGNDVHAEAINGASAAALARALAQLAKGIDAALDTARTT